MAINDDEDLIALAKNGIQAKPFTHDSTPPEEFINFMSESGLTRDPEHYIKFRHIYWLYLKWRGGDHKAIKRVRFGRFLGHFFVRQGRDRFYVGPKELFIKDKHERRLQLLQERKETCLKRKRTKMLRRLVAEKRIRPDLAKRGRLQYLKDQSPSYLRSKKGSTQE